MTEKKRKHRLFMPGDPKSEIFTRRLKASHEHRIIFESKLEIDPKATYTITNFDELKGVFSRHGPIPEYLEIIEGYETSEAYDTSEPEETHEEPKAQPPAAADFIITAMMGSKAADAAIGDLTEMFHRNVSSGMSPTNAKAKYWGEVFFLAGPMLKELAKRLGLMSLAGRLLGL